MKRFLEKGIKIRLVSDGRSVDFLIDSVIDAGGSCVAYKVKYYERDVIPHIGILKEYCPAFLITDSFERSGTALVVDSACRQIFDSGLEDFKQSYKAINEYLSTNAVASNYHTVQLGLYEGNNTAYTLTSYDYGLSYEKLSGESLISICKIMLAVSKAVEQYHNAGFLHLDIKPENILILSEVTDLIKLFDFDSLTSIEKLRKNEVYAVPAPETYYVPELHRTSFRDISVRTDIFEIGAMLFLRVFKRAPTAHDMTHDSVYRLDDNELFTGVSPRAKDCFCHILKKTLQIAPHMRFDSIVELRTGLEELIALLSNSSAYLINLPKWQPSKYCVGRRDELKHIKQMLDEYGYVFIRAIGGLGKSEIAKMFAHRYADEFHTIQFCRYSGSLKAVVAKMAVSGIDNKDYDNIDALVEEKNKVLRLADSKTLVIIDNFNVTYDDFLRDFLPADNHGFKVIFTTRCTMASEYYDKNTYCLPKLSLNDCRRLFFSHAAITADAQSEELSDRLIGLVDYNTLIIVLMALAVKILSIPLESLIEKLNEQEIETLDAKIFHEYDYATGETLAYNKIYSHLQTIFNVCALSTSQKELLKNATLISQSGIGVDEFIQGCSSDSIKRDDVEGIISLGWIEKSDDNKIYMHPVVSDMLSANEELPQTSSYYSFEQYLLDFVNPAISHYSLALDRLACAKHLYRRCKFESDEKTMVSSVKLARMYQNLYQPADAREYYNTAINIASRLNSEAALSYHDERHAFAGVYKSTFLAYLYFFVGEFEYQFGTTVNAVAYLKKCVCESTKIECRAYFIALNAIMYIAACYRRDNLIAEAYIYYLAALNYAKKYNQLKQIPIFADCLIQICDDLNKSELKAVFLRVKAKYSAESNHDNNACDELLEEIDSFEALKYPDGGVAELEGMLSQLSSYVGEASPLYKNARTKLWTAYYCNNERERAMYLLNESLNFIAETHGYMSVAMANQLCTAAIFVLSSFDFKIAVLFCEKAIDICIRLNETQSFSYTASNIILAFYYSLRADKARALDYIENANLDKYSSNLMNTAMLNFIVIIDGCFDFEIECTSAFYDRYISGGFGSAPERAMAYLALGSKYERKADLPQAEKYAGMINRLSPSAQELFGDGPVSAFYYLLAARLKGRRGGHSQSAAIITRGIENIIESKYAEHYSYILFGLYCERGMFFAENYKMKEAKQDFERAESLISESAVPDELRIALYRGRADYYMLLENYEQAMECFMKIQSCSELYLNPETYNQAMTCLKIGHCESMLGHTVKGMALVQRAEKVLREYANVNVRDRFILNDVIGRMQIGRQRYNEALERYTALRSQYDCRYDIEGALILSCTVMIIALLLTLGRFDEADNVAWEEIGKLEERFPENTYVSRVLALRAGGLFKESGDGRCCKFFAAAQRLIDGAQAYKTLENAELLNYFGVMCVELKQQYAKAMEYFKLSERLICELGEADSALHKLVLDNIKHVNEML